MLGLRKLKSAYDNNLKYKGAEKLSKIAILLIIFLNINILSVIYMGIDFQSKVLINPKTHFPYQCIRAYSYPYKINEPINMTYYGSNINNNMYSSGVTIKNDKINEHCKFFSTQLNKINSKKNLKTLQSAIRNLNSKIKYYDRDIRYHEQNYNTVLFEKMANQKSEDSILKNNLTSSNIKNKYNKLKNERKKIVNKKDKLIKEYKNLEEVKTLYSYLLKNKSKVLELNDYAKRTYVIKSKLIEIIFSLPLMIIFYILTKRFLRKDEYIKYIISKNLMIISFIPFIIAVGTLIYEYMPKVFIGKLIAFFYSIEIPFIVYYLLIFVIIAVLGFIIIRIQRNYSLKNEKEKNFTITKFISFNNSQCPNCKIKINYEYMDFCPNCSETLKEECANCKKKKIKGLDFCHKCGKGNK